MHRYRSRSMALVIAFEQLRSHSEGKLLLMCNILLACHVVVSSTQEHRLYDAIDYDEVPLCIDIDCDQ
jgi:hypothetical protein